MHGRITRREIESLDSLIEKFGRRLLSKGRSFVIPGKNTLSAIFDVARAITRRAERRVVALKRKRRLRNKVVIVYLNRLSDLLFLIARYSEKNRRRWSTLGEASAEKNKRDGRNFATGLSPRQNGP